MPELPEDDDEKEARKKDLSVVGKIIAAIGILVMVVSGGCSLIVGVPMLFGEFGLLPAVLLFGGIPFAIGYFIFWFATKGGRKSGLPPESP